MIAKLKSVINVAPVIEYNEEKVLKGEAERIYNNTIFDHKDELITEFNEVSDLNKNLKTNKFMHIPVSFPIGERPDKKFATTILEDYLRKMGYENRPILIYQHNDTDKLHFHIVVPTTDYEGIKTLENYNYRKNEKVTRELEKKYGLQETIYKLSNEKDHDRDIRLHRISKSLTSIPRKAAFEVLANLGLDYDSVKSSSNKDIKNKIGEKKYQQLYSDLQTNDLLVFSNLERLRFELTSLLRQSKNEAEFKQKIEKSGNYYKKNIDPIKGNYIEYGFKLPDGSKSYFRDYKIGKKFTARELFKTNSIQIKSDKPKQAKIDLEPQHKKRHISALFRIAQTSVSMEEFMSRTTKAGIISMPIINKSGYSGMSFEINGQVFKASDLHRNLSVNKIINRISLNAISNDIVVKPEKQIKSNQSHIPKLSNNNNDHSDEQKEQMKKKKRDREQDQGKEM